jgi:hypothetical protein
VAYLAQGRAEVSKTEVTIHGYSFDTLKLNIERTDGDTDYKTEARELYEFLAHALPSATFYALAKEFGSEWAT